MPGGRARARAAHDHDELRRPDEGPGPAARSAGQGAHRTRRRRARHHREAEGQEQDPRAHRAARPHRLGAVRVGRDHRAHRRAVRRGRGGGRAVALRGLLAARGRGDGVRGAAGRAPPAARSPRSSAPTARPGSWCRPATPTRSRTCCCGRWATPTCGRASAPPVAPASSTSSRGARLRVGTVENYRALLDERAAAGHRLMLTVDFDRLDLRAGQRAARHGLRRWAPRVRRHAARCDGRRPRLRRRRAEGGTRHAWRDDRGGRDPGRRARRRGERRRAAPPLPRRQLRPHHRVGSARAPVGRHPRDRRAGARAPTRVGGWRSRCRPGSPSA